MEIVSRAGTRVNATAGKDSRRVKPFKNVTLGPTVETWSIQKPNRVFPVIAGVQAKFVQHQVLRFAPSFAITFVDRPKIFPLRLVPQPITLSPSQSQQAFSSAGDSICP